MDIFATQGKLKYFTWNLYALEAKHDLFNKNIFKKLFIFS